MKLTIGFLCFAFLVSTAQGDLLHNRNLRGRKQERITLVAELSDEDRKFWDRELQGSSRRKLQGDVNKKKEAVKEEDEQFWSRQLQSGRRD